MVKLRRGDGKKRSRKLLRQMTHQMENSARRRRVADRKKRRAMLTLFRPLFVLLLLHSVGKSPKMSH